MTVLVPRLNGHRVAQLRADQVDTFVDSAGDTWTWDAFGTRYVRSAAGARRYGVPIGSPIPTGRKVRNRTMPDGSTRIRLTPAQRALSGRVFGEGSGANGANHGGGVNLDVDNPQAAAKALDSALAQDDLTPGQRRTVRVLRDKIAGLDRPADADSGSPDAPSAPAGSGVAADIPDVTDMPGDPATAPARRDIRIAYDEIAPERGRWIGLADLRDHLEASGLSRPEVDAALEDLAFEPGVHVQAESNQKTLTPRDRAAAVRFGGDDRHLLMIEPPFDDTPLFTTEPAHLADNQPEEGAMADTATIDPETAAPVVEVGPEVDGEMRVRFPVLVIEALDTSDGRFLEAGSLTHRALPLSLLAQPEASHGGDEPGPSIVIGRLDTMQRTPGPEVISKRTGEPFPEGTFVWSATGAIDANHPVADLVRRGFLRGVSVDLAGMDYDVLGMPMSDDEPGLPLDPDNPRRQLVTHSAEIAAATLVPIPAFGDAYVELASEDVVPEPVAAEDLPEGLLASAVPAWRSPEVGDLVAIIAAADEGMPVRIPADSVEQLATVIDTGTERDATELATAIVEHIATNWGLEEPVTEAELPADEAVVAAADEPVVDEADEDAGFPESPQPCQYGPEPAVESLVFRDGDAYLPTCADHREQADEELAAAGEVVAEVVPIEDGDEADADEDIPVVTASMSEPSDEQPDIPLPAPIEEDAVTAAAATRPSADWFADPELDGPTALRVTEDGRVYGHLAAWDVPHIGMPNQRVTAPKSASGYAYFTVGAVLCDDGSEVPVGHITLDTGHAPTTLGQQAAAAHYDHTGTVVADVAAGEDQYGIWVAGAMRPGVSEATVAKLRASALSGDWRRVGSSLELVAALAVNTPGFPIPRARARVASGAPQSLVAAGVIRPNDTPDEPAVFDVDSFADAIAARLEQRQRDGELSARHSALVTELDDTPAVVAALLAEVDDSPQRAAALLAELDDDFLSGMPPQLKEEWLTGKVAARIAWGTPGAMTRCMAEAKDHDIPERQRGGMCQNLKQVAEAGD